MDFLLGNGSELEFYSKRYEKPLEYSEKRSGMGQLMLHQCFWLCHGLWTEVGESDSRVAS